MDEQQLNPCGWFIEEEKRTEALLNQMRWVMGTFETDRNTTFAFFQGYLNGVKRMYRKFEETPPIYVKKDSGVKL